MTVKELKKLLENHPNDKKVMVLVNEIGYFVQGIEVFENVKDTVYIEATNGI